MGWAVATPPPGAFRCDARSSLSTSLYKSVHLGLLPAWLRTLLGKRVREVGPQKQVPHLTSPRATNAPDSSALWVTTCYDLVHGWLPGGSQSSRTWPCPGQIARGCTPKMHPTGELPPGLSILPTFPAPPLAAGRATLLASLEKCEQCSLSPGSPTSPPPAPAEKGAGPWHWLLPLPSTPTHLPSFGVSGSPGSLGSSLITALVALRTPGLCLHLFSSSPVPPPPLSSLSSSGSRPREQLGSGLNPYCSLLWVKLSWGSYSVGAGQRPLAKGEVSLPTCGSVGPVVRSWGQKQPACGGRWWWWGEAVLSFSARTLPTWAVGAAQHIPDQQPKPQQGQALRGHSPVDSATAATRQPRSHSPARGRVQSPGLQDWAYTQTFRCGYSGQPSPRPPS